MSDDNKPRVDKMTGEAFRKGKCAVCGKHTERIKTFVAATMELLNAKVRAWDEEPIMHKRCEMFWDPERHCVIGAP